LLARTGFKVKRNLPALHSVEVMGATVGSLPVVRYPSSLPQSRRQGSSSWDRRRSPSA